MNCFRIVKNALKIIFANKQVVAVYLLCQIISYYCILYSVEAGIDMTLSSEYMTHTYAFAAASAEDLDYIESYAVQSEDIQYVALQTPDGAYCYIKRNRSVTLASGRLPDNDADALQAALPENAAAELGVTAGSVIQTGETAVTVTGILKDSFVIVNKAYVARNGFSGVTVKATRYESGQIDALTAELASRGATYTAPPRANILLLMRENPLSLVIAALAVIIIISTLIIYKYYYLRLKRFNLIMRQEGSRVRDVYFSTSLTCLALAALIAVCGSVVFGVVGFIAGRTGGNYVMSGYALGAAEHFAVAISYLAAVLVLSLLYITALTRKKRKTND